MNAPPFPPPHRRAVDHRPLPRRTLRRAAAVIGLTAGLIGLGATSASAHVTVHPDSTEPGSYTQLTFRVPTESADASTTSLSVTLPQDHPFTSVSVRPVPGWTATLHEHKLPEPVEIGGATITKAVRTVTWKAAPGDGIKPGQYQEFALSVGRLPQQGELDFPATQRYSDGTVVRWDEPSKPGGAEPEHPAPSLTVAAEPGATPASSADDGGDGLARGLGGGALAVGLAGLGVAVNGRRSRTGGPR